MNYEQEYKKAFEAAKGLHDAGNALTKKQMEIVFPQLAESEDERMMREFNDWLCEEIECRTNDLRDEKDRRTLNMLCYVLTKLKDYLEKQKELPFVKDVMLGYPGLYFYDGERMHFRGSLAMEEKHKEPHYTKRNALFDKCVENCDPEVMKKVSDEIDEMLQKEQKPILEVFGFKVGDAVRLKDGDGRKHIIKSFEEVEGLHGPNFYHVEFEDDSARSGIYTDEEYPNGYYTQMEKFEEEQKPAEYLDKDKVYAIMKKLHDLAFSQRIPIDSDEYKKIGEITSDVRSLLDYPIEQKPAEWSEADEEKLKAICTYLRDYSRLVKLGDKLRFNEYCDFLESLRPQGSKDSLQTHWKPSEEQMDVLLNTEGMIRASGYPENAKVLASLYEALKKL